MTLVTNNNNYSLILVQNFSINIIYIFTHEITIFPVATFLAVAIQWTKAQKMSDEDNLSPRLFTREIRIIISHCFVRDQIILIELIMMITLL